MLDKILEINAMVVKQNEQIRKVFKKILDTPLLPLVCLSSLRRNSETQTRLEVWGRNIQKEPFLKLFFKFFLDSLFCSTNSPRNSST